ncbi:MAG: hypothetical protein A2189_04235 [Paenibacillus sp. RIFOXYA1_FULL_44_5]|nr:MAG: hypothetical protein A2189_04235 [Paenibacillus sp. RIFOXYA1_FULL_44_5]
MLSAFEEYRHIEVPSSALNEKLSSLEEALKRGSESAVLYYQDKEAVASCRFKFDEHSLYFSRLSVCPEVRGKGIARAILLWLENHAMDQGRTEMWCRVRMAMARNIDLYKSVGFLVAKEEVVINPNGLPVQTIVMRKQL